MHVFDSIIVINMSAFRITRAMTQTSAIETMEQSGYAVLSMRQYNDRMIMATRDLNRIILCIRPAGENISYVSGYVIA